VIHVIDVENWAGYSDTSYTAKIQARYTDLIVFNKWEVAGEQRMEVCLDRVGDLEESIAWVKSDRGRVPVSIILIYFCCLFLRELRARKASPKPTLCSCCGPMLGSLTLGFSLGVLRRPILI
jgi:G3E family GTPase